MLVTPFHEIEKELQDVQDYTDCHIDDDNITTTEQRGNMLSVYLSRTAKLKADAKYYKNKKVNSEIMEQMKRLLDLAPSSQSKMIDNLCADENMLLEWADRLNSVCTHQLDWCRSLLSKQKEEMRNLNYGK